MVRALPGYELIQMLHRGGQGVVYHAVQNSTGREVAIKLLRHGPISSADEQARLRREVQVLGQLRHPSIVTIHDSGQHDGLFYFVMDYIDGRPLDAYVADAEISQEALAGLFQRIAEAVQAAHLRGVIHRDLKPANILVDAAGEPHVVDFGLAKLDGDGGRFSAMTQTGLFVGSLPWSSPEQARGDQRAIDVRTDVYSLGVVFWHALTGVFPYDISGDMPSALRNILEAEPSFAVGTRVRVRRDLETILRKCLAKTPERRYQNAGELAADLGRYRSGKPIAARRDSTAYVLSRTVARHKLTFGLLAAIFALAVGSAIGLGVLFAESQRSARALATSLYQSSIDLAERAFHDGNAGALRAALDRAPPGLRQWEWNYLHRQADTSQLFIPRSAQTACWAPDGRRLAALFRNEDLSLIDAETGAVLRTFDNGRALYPHAAFSPDGRRLAIGGMEYRARIWDVENGQLLREIPKEVPDDSEFTRVHWSVDGLRLLMWGEPLELRTYDAASGDLHTQRPIYFGLDVQVAAASDRLAIADDHKIEIVDAGAATTATHRLSRTRQTTMALTPTADRLFAVLDGRVTGFNLPEMASFGEFGEYNPPVLLAASGEGGLAIASGETVWYVTDVDAGGARRRLMGHSAYIQDLAFSLDGSRLVTTGNDGLRIWDVTQSPVLMKADGWLTGLAVSESGRWLATCGPDRKVRVIDARSREVLFETETQNRRHYGLAFAPDESALVWNDERARRLDFIDTSDWSRLPIEIPCRVPCWGIDWSPDGDLLAVGQPARGVTRPSNDTDRVVEIWSLKEQRRVFEIPGYATARFSPDGRHLLAFNTAPFGAVNEAGPELDLWRVAPPERLLSIGDGDDEVEAVAWANDGRWFAAGYNDTVIRLWDLNGRSLGELHGHDTVVQALAIAPNDRRLASGGSEGVIRVWDLPERHTMLTLPAHDAWVNCLTFSPDGHLLYSAGQDGTLRIWDGRPIQRRLNAPATQSPK